MQSLSECIVDKNNPIWKKSWQNRERVIWSNLYNNYHFMTDFEWERYEFESVAYPGHIGRVSWVKKLPDGRQRVIWLANAIPDSVAELVVGASASCDNCWDRRFENLCAPFRSNLLARRLNLAHTPIDQNGFLSASLVRIPPDRHPICPLYIPDASIFATLVQWSGRSEEYVQWFYPNSAKLLF